MSIFFDFIRNSLFRSKKHSFLSRLSKNVSFWSFFAQKRHRNKSLFCDKKPWSNPFQKYRFFDLLQNFTFEVEKAFFSILNIKKMCLFSLFLQNMRERSIFWQKPWTNRLSQMTFFFRFVKLDCVSLKGIHFYTDYKKRSVFT